MAQESEAVGRATQAGQEVSSGAQAAIERAISVLGPYEDEPRIAALTEKLRAIGSPTDGFSAGDYGGDAEVVKSMVEAESIAKSEAASPALRERAASVARDLQLLHLQEFNPRAAAEYRRARVDA